MTFTSALPALPKRLFFVYAFNLHSICKHRSLAQFPGGTSILVCYFAQKLILYKSIFNLEIITTLCMFADGCQNLILCKCKEFPVSFQRLRRSDCQGILPLLEHSSVHVSENSGRNEDISTCKFVCMS